MTPGQVPQIVVSNRATEVADDPAVSGTVGHVVVSGVQEQRPFTDSPFVRSRSGAGSEQELISDPAVAQDLQPGSLQCRRACSDGEKDREWCRDGGVGRTVETGCDSSVAR